MKFPDLKLWIIAGFVILLFVTGPTVSAHGIVKDDDPDDTPEDQEVRYSYHDETGQLTFLGVDPERPINIPSALRSHLQAEDRAIIALDEFGEAFGIRDPSTELSFASKNSLEGGRSSVRYHQLHDGIPVIGGEIVVNLTGRGGLTSINGEISPNLVLSTTPRVTPQEVVETAFHLVSRTYNVERKDLGAETPELWIYDPRLIGVVDNPPSLVWRTEVTSSQRLDIREFVLIDASTGFVVLNFNQVDTIGLNRQIYDNENNSGYGLPGNGPVRSEGSGPHAVTDVNDAYEFSGDTYDFYDNEHDRDSLDNAGMPLVSTVRYCPPSQSCPYTNAFWNGTQMAYGEGFAAADDVVGHELTHGVTDFTSHLFYYHQSGALNESLSDIWGEFIDLTNGSGTDTPAVRWRMGEDIPGYPLGIRDMENPPLFSDPDRIGSGNYYCGGLDYGGVHTNSGVNNKAAFLMTDGGSFNGKTVTGLGISKVADLYYEVQTNFLTSGSNYLDLYNALIQASVVLEFDESERQSVKDTLDAVEMNLRPCGDSDPALVCDGWDSPLHLYFDDLENPASGNWVSGPVQPALDHWSYPQNPNTFPYWTLDATYGTSGSYNFYAYDTQFPADYAIAMTFDVTLPDNAYLHFSHDWNFDGSAPLGFDGSVVEYSTNGGGGWNDTAALFTHNGYNGTVWIMNSMGNRAAFVGESHGYTTSRLDLSSLSGDSIRFRFRLGTDDIVDGWGWFIDDIRIYTCEPPLFIPGVFR
jgi:Zn-dependent metalloprotease